jgi:hypothetical protein
MIVKIDGLDSCKLTITFQFDISVGIFHTHRTHTRASDYTVKQELNFLDFFFFKH